MTARKAKKKTEDNPIERLQSFIDDEFGHDEISATDRDSLYTLFSNDQRAILVTKNKDYSGGRSDQDANANFNEIARLLKDAPMTPYTVAMIYFLKHVFSLISFCRTRAQESGEPIHGRHIDVANYAFIMDLLAERHAKP